jgi:FeS assembly protein IscX
LGIALTEYALELYWDATYAIALALMEQHPDRSPLSVGVQELLELVQALSGFRDDPTIVSEQILLDILKVWYEETVSP